MPNTVIVKKFPQLSGAELLIEDILETKLYKENPSFVEDILEAVLAEDGGLSYLESNPFVFSWIDRELTYYDRTCELEPKDFVDLFAMASYGLANAMNGAKSLAVMPRKRFKECLKRFDKITFPEPYNANHASVVLDFLGRFNEETFDDNFMKDFNKILCDDITSRTDSSALCVAITNVGLGAKGMLKHLHNLIVENRDKYRFMLSGLYRTAPIPFDTFKGLENLIQRLEDGSINKDDAAALINQNNAFGMRAGEYGLSSYISTAYSAKVTPLNTMLILRAREDITSDNNRRFAEVRKDAYRLSGVLCRGRDWIHDERPGTHIILKAMYNFYINRGEKGTRAALKKALAVWGDSCYNAVGDFCFDYENYEKDTYFRDEISIKAYKVLERLVENTEPYTEQDMPKLPGFEKLKIDEAVEIRKIRVALDYIVNDLIEKQGSYQGSPEYYRAIGIAKRISTIALRNISKKDWRELVFDPTFKYICMLNELTTSTSKSFNASEFEVFWQKFSKIEADASDSEIANNFNLLTGRLVRKCEAVLKMYNEHSWSKRYGMTLYSGNLMHELMGLNTRF